MATVCCFRDTSAPDCPAPATHAVQRALLDRAWRVVPTSVSTFGFAVLTAEFCVSHAEAVCALRNLPLQQRTS